MNKYKYGIILQARVNSTRLPRKVLLPFYYNNSILDIIIRNLKSIKTIPLIVATSTNKKDDEIIDKCIENNIKFYRGSEKNVLQRFIEAAEKHNINVIIRICADNPFIQINSIKKLFNEFVRSKIKPDYLSYEINGCPAILSHFGFYGEIVTLKVLKDIKCKTKEKYYYEHLTSYIYSNPKLYKIKYIKAPKIIYYRKDIRLTIDTLEDFKIAKVIYYATKNIHSISSIINAIDKKNNIKNEMINEINKNKK